MAQRVICHNCGEVITFVLKPPRFVDMPLRRCKCGRGIRWGLAGLRDSMVADARVLVDCWDCMAAAPPKSHKKKVVYERSF